MTMNALNTKSPDTRQAAHVADDLLLVLGWLPGPDPLMEHNKTLFHAANDLIQSTDPDVILLGFLLGLQLVASTPAPTLGETVQQLAISLHKQIAADIELPAMNAGLITQMLPFVVAKREEMQPAAA